MSATLDEDTFVYIVDDDSRVRASVAALVESQGVRTREFASAEEFLVVASADLCGCLVVDVRMQGMGGLELHEEMHRRQITLPVIVITGYADVPMAVRALQGGAIGFLTKPCQPDQLWETISRALEQSRQARRVREQQRAIEQRLRALTAGERLVLVKVLSGVPNKRIARDLDIGLRTVELRRANLMKKMEAASLAELIQIVLQVGSLDTEAWGPAPPPE